VNLQRDPVRRASVGPSGARGTSEGTEAQGGEGALRRQRRRALQAWIPEQRLEGDRRLVGATPGGHQPAVTRDGWDRGSSFEGQEASRGTRTPRRGRAFGRRSRVGRVGNAANPRIGSGMQQARDPDGGGSRRGGAKPRGRNETAELDAPSPKPAALRSGGWEWTPLDTSMEGRRFPRARRRPRGEVGSPGEEGRHDRVRAADRPEPNRGAERERRPRGWSRRCQRWRRRARTGRQTSGTAPETVNGRGGSAGKAHDPHRHARGEHRHRSATTRTALATSKIT
jgi:hypothetical protein